MVNEKTGLKKIIRTGEFDSATPSFRQSLFTATTNPWRIVNIAVHCSNVGAENAIYMLGTRIDPSKFGTFSDTFTNIDDVKYIQIRKDFILNPGESLYLSKANRVGYGTVVAFQIELHEVLT